MEAAECAYRHVSQTGARVNARTSCTDAFLASGWQGWLTSVSFAQGAVVYSRLSGISDGPVNQCHSHIRYQTCAEFGKRPDPHVDGARMMFGIPVCGDAAYVVVFVWGPF